MSINNKPTISVILPTYNRLNRLRQVLTALENQTYPLEDVEVIVVADGCRDGTVEYLHTLKTPLRLRVDASVNQGVAAARNRGIHQATGELVVFIDDDVLPTPALLAEHQRVHADSSAELVVLGPMLNPPDFKLSSWVAWEQAMLMKQYTDMQAGHWQPTPRQFYTGNASLARRHLLAVGGFDETFRRAEDVELAYRLEQQGLRFVFHPEAIGYHYAERSFRSWLDIPYIYGRNDVIFTQSRGQSWLLPTVMREFHQRNRQIRRMVRVCVGRAPLTAGALAALGLAAMTGNRLGLARLSQMAHSGIFNLRYYQGITDELGGRSPFLRQLDGSPPAPYSPDNVTI